MNILRDYDTYTLIALFRMTNYLKEPYEERSFDILSTIFK